MNEEDVVERGSVYRHRKRRYSDDRKEKKKKNEYFFHSKKRRTKKNKKRRKEGEENGQPVYLCIYLLSKFYWPQGGDNGAAKTSGGPQGDNSRPATANCDDSFYPATSSIRLRRTSRHDKSVSR